MLIRTFNFYFNFALAIIWPLTTLAAPTLSVSLKGSGISGVASVQAGSNSATEIEFLYISSNSISSTIGIQIAGPQGLVASLDAAKIQGSVSETIRRGNFWKMYLSGSLIASKLTTRKASAITSPTPVTRGELSIDCNGLSTSAIQDIIATIAKESGATLTAADICNYSGISSAVDNSSIPLPDSSVVNNPSFGSARGLLQKDNCDKGGYLVRLKISLKVVSAENLLNGFDITSSISESNYTGGRATSLKPISSGQYAPSPLLLMQGIGGSQWINVVSWIRNKPVIRAKVAALPGLVFYHGYFFIRALANKALVGGRGTLELTNGYDVYGVCLSLSKTRQRVNGYPGGD